MSVTCRSFTDFLARKSEHLDDLIIRSLHPTDTWIGKVNVGRFRAEDGVEHTYDRFENVFPDLSGCWTDVSAGSCVGTPCDPTETLIGLGFTRDSYKLQRRSYATDLFCFDQILSADRAKEQFAHIIRTLRRCSSLITSHRLRTEAFRIAKFKWVLRNNTLEALTATWNADCTKLTISNLPSSKITARHLQRRVIPQRLAGALNETPVATDSGERRGAIAPFLEFCTDPETLWEMIEGNSELSDKWRFSEFEDAQKFYQYGWDGHVGNYAIRTDTSCLRFKRIGNSNQLQLIFPYSNVAATEGIKEDINPDYLDAEFQLSCIHHRMAMTSLVQDTTQINPEMPFAMRDFAGKWQFVMDNLTCGLDTNGNPIAVDNARRNKGKFLADWRFATKAEYPEFEEWFLHLRQPACVVDSPICATVSTGYPTQDYTSDNDPC